ncbi:hypothetical protein [Ferrimicrobium acidiphilum]|uniref:hypothetical protein n=1 Tax=Ferrimicrobium acidiphilum TaxID=121039 RepID=UPI0023F3A0FB|nr:hypothetical protein [Ferrimicrobium acidiphilum]
MSVGELEMDENCQNEGFLEIRLDSTDGGGGAYLFAEHFDIFTWWVEVLRYLAKGFELRLDEDE